jgi:hypothetical protein
MKLLAVVAAAIAALVAAVLVSAVAAPSASAHRSWCHARHTCPSDHATYWWRSPRTGIRWLCVKPTAEERNSTFRKRIVYAGRVYYCKR